MKLWAVVFPPPYIYMKGISEMKEYYIVAKTDGVMFIEEYERKEDGSLSEFYSKYIDGFITIFNSRIKAPKADKNRPDILVICDDEAILKDLDLNIIGSILYGDYILGNVIIGCSGYFNGEPDIVGFETKQNAIKFMEILQMHYKVIMDREKK